MSGSITLGTLELTRRKVDPLQSAALRRAYMRTAEPDRSLVALAALGLTTEGPKDWPTPKGSYIDQGGALYRYLLLQGVEIETARFLGELAIASLEAATMQEEKAKEYADFFGVKLDSQTG